MGPALVAGSPLPVVASPVNRSTTLWATTVLAPTIFRTRHTENMARYRPELQGEVRERPNRTHC
jgi:hypothetical protein